jgi:hypothetical protein
MVEIEVIRFHFEEKCAQNFEFTPFRDHFF